MTASLTSLPLKHPALAGVLAFLIPGLGHLYQRRFFKAFLFAFCIWGSWWTGMAMSDWKALQAPAKGHTQFPVVLKYAGQCGVGLPSLWALYQADRFYSPDNIATNHFVDQPTRFPFSGFANLREGTGNQSGDLEGMLFVEPTRGDFGDAMTGTIEGNLDGQATTITLDKDVSFDAPIRASRTIRVKAAALDKEGGYIGQVEGEIPRAFLNWFGAPLTREEEGEWHRDLGKFQELAMVFVWVAGLMNLLAVWDAVEGPAYGIDDAGETPAAPPPATA